MIEKCESLTGADATALALVKKLNEVIEVLNVEQPRTTRPVPTNLQHAEFIISMCQRVRSGPLQFIRQSEPNALTEAMDVALSALHTATTAYIASVPKEPE